MRFGRRRHQRRRRDASDNSRFPFANHRGHGGSFIIPIRNQTNLIIQGVDRQCARAFERQIFTCMAEHNFTSISRKAMTNRDPNFLGGLEDSSSTRLLPLGRLGSKKRKNPRSSSSEAEGDQQIVAILKATYGVARSGIKQGEALAPRPDEEQEDEEPKSPSTEEEGDDHCVAIKKAPLTTSCSRSSIMTPILSLYQVVSPPSEHQEATALVAITSAEVWEERDEGCVVLKEATGPWSRSGLNCPLSTARSNATGRLSLSW
ncbi:hypothetical protein Taro_001971 [Colocasia esculenta]|uniref:Uncharacterized protein n=1 Tax=Colocasia esculenta TaxID=4460 RepID=A0A843THU1_COLES|nr:hypothetical protein [Colocasia esculenta]